MRKRKTIAPPCSFDGCGHMVYAKRLCAAHYKQQLDGRSLYPVKRYGLPIERRFAANIPASKSPDECWEWTGGRNAQGYGILRVSRKNVGAHRISWSINRGEIPGGLWVLHRCDNPPCVNPNHLFIGSSLDNIADKVVKGRQMRGERHSSAKLTCDDVIDIRSLYAFGARQVDLADAFGVGQTQVSRITLGKSWSTHQ